jgi:hypothetical protein
VKLIIVLVFDLIVDDTMNHLFLFFSHREILNIDTDKKSLGVGFFYCIIFFVPPRGVIGISLDRNPFEFNFDEILEKNANVSGCK